MRIVSINNPASGIATDADPVGLPTEAIAYTVERDKNGRVTRVQLPAVTLLDEVVAGPPGACPQCGAVPDSRPVRESEDKTHKLYRCGKCGTDFAVTTALEH